MLPLPRTTIYALLALVGVLVAACDNPAPGEGVDHPPMEKTQPAVTSGREAVRSADIPKSDPATMVEAEIRARVAEGPRCMFTYTAESRPVLAAGMATEMQDTNGAQGITKIHGRLVPLVAPKIADFATLTGGGTFLGEGLSLTVVPDAEAQWDKTAEDTRRRRANLHFHLEQGLDVGYRGWYVCKE